MSTCSLSESQIQEASTWLPSLGSALLRFSRFKDQHALKLQELLYQQTLQNSSFCDVTIQIGDGTVKAHWCVLVLCPYFQSLYDSGMRESKSGKLKLDFGCPFAMKEAIRFLYTGHVQVTFEKVRSLLEVADYLQISDMKQLCADFLGTVDLTLDNCVQIALLSSMYNIDYLYHRSFQFLCGHLPELLIKDDMLQLTKDSVQALITDPTLSYVKREAFFDFIIRWVNHEKEKRKDSFEELFSLLDLKSMSSTFLSTQVENNPLVLASEKCKVQFLETKIQSMAGLCSGSSETQDVIVLCGGSGHDSSFLASVFIGSGASDSVFAYIISEDRWVKLPPLPFPIRRPLVALDDQGKVFVFDSSSITESQMYLLCYNPSANSWTGTKLKFPEGEDDFRIHSFMIESGRMLFVFSSVKQPKPAILSPHPPHGKSAATPTLSSIWHVQLLEMDAETGNLSVLTTLFQRNASTEVRVCSSQGPSNSGSVYVLGNKVHNPHSKSRNNRKPSKFLIYDLKTNRKKEYGRSVYEQCLYAVPGGCLATRPGKVSARFFSLRHKRWMTDKSHSIRLPPTDPNREDYGTLSMNDDIYMFGGKLMDTKKATASAARYSVATQTWTELASLPTPLMGPGVAVGRMPTDVLRCHLECPHCILNPHRTRTTYQINVRGYMRDDDDNEDGMDSSYDYGGSDYSDYDDYYDPSYSDDGWGYAFGYDPDEDFFLG